MESNKRFRNYVGIGYPESLKNGWIDILENTHIKTLISPLHDKDFDENGELKKPHYHIILIFENKKSFKQVQEIFNAINAFQKIEAVHSLKGQARYLCHLDNAKKHKYDINDVKALNGVNFLKLIETDEIKLEIISSMINFIEKNNFVFFSDFLKYCSENNKIWFKSLCENSGWIILKYLQSRSFKDHNN